MNDTSSAKLVALGVHFAMYIETLVSTLMIEALRKVKSIPAEELQSFAKGSVSRALTDSSRAYTEALLSSDKGCISYNKFSLILRSVMLQDPDCDLPFIQALRAGFVGAETVFELHAQAQYECMDYYSSWFFPFSRAVALVQTRTSERISVRNISSYYWEVVGEVLRKNPEVMPDFCKKASLLSVAMIEAAILFFKTKGQLEELNERNFAIGFVKSVLAVVKAELAKL